MTLTGKFVYISDDITLLLQEVLGLRVDMQGWQFENSMS